MMPKAGTNCVRWSSPTRCTGWLVNAHAALDVAVADAYGWPANLDDAAILERLLALNLQRTLQQA